MHIRSPIRGFKNSSAKPSDLIYPEKKPAGAGRVNAVAAGSSAREAGFRPGDRLLFLNGCRLRDIIDYRFCLEDGINKLEAERDGHRIKIRLRVRPGEDPGLSFSSPVFDRVLACRCRCRFCFVDQLPGGLRKPLYFRDDDFRLSFLYGNFITLGNLAEDDVRRIISQRLSPLHVSVHATDPGVRSMLMGVSEEDADRGLRLLRRLGEEGIMTNIQVVLCPGINDGPVLERTMTALAEEFKAVNSVGVVPVALDPGFIRRSGPIPVAGGAGRMLRPVTAADSEAAIESITGCQERHRREHGHGFVYAADELYLRAGLPLPPPDTYDGFPQYQNGIGIGTSFMEEFERIIAGLLGEIRKPECACLLSGTLARRLIGNACDRLTESRGHDIRPLVAENRTFGAHVSVTGLLGGRDIVAAAREAGLSRGDLLIIPRFCLSGDGQDGPRFLDGLTLDGLKRALGGVAVKAA
ncbi:MAG: DUF512 domain-containing protein [Thermoleophilia bacterium]|nr:DUF512 domain-containing protein [Thermoleophilia bacterium]